MTRTFTDDAGSVTVTFDGIGLHLDAFEAAAGFEAKVKHEAADKIEVKFYESDDWGKARIRVTIGNCEPVGIADGVDHDFGFGNDKSRDGDRSHHDKWDDDNDSRGRDGWGGHKKRR